MTSTVGSFPRRDPAVLNGLVLLSAAAVALVSARGYAGGWNDGSRLATVECLVDHRTLAIDDSVFVRVPPPAGPAAPRPYPANEPGLLERGTADKLLIDGRYYSDKSPVPAVLMAGLYAAWQAWTGQTARAQPDRFVRAMTLGTSGVAYVVAVWCLFRLGRRLRLDSSVGLLLTASFALATVALPYVRHVNNHILLLGVAAALMLNLAGLADALRGGRVSWPRLLAVGSLAGLGYAIDLGAGPVLLLCTAGWVVYRCRRLVPVAGFALAALPWLALHHALNYKVGGTLGPANAVPEYFQWPGCPFNARNLTGGWQHGDVGHFLTYAAALLAGKRGFLGHSLPLFAAVAGFVVLLRCRAAELPELLFAGCWCVGTWLLYAATSNNYSGLCCSVRWFVPLLAPAYYVLAVFLHRHPRYLPDFLILSAWGAVTAGLMWWYGPWMKHMVPFYWFIQAAALLSWLGYRVWWRGEAAVLPLEGARHMAEAA
jgi:hypothetical protein